MRTGTANRQDPSHQSKTYTTPNCREHSETDQAKARATRSFARAPKTTATPASTAQENPIFCFRHADRRGAAPKFDPSPEEASEVLSFICELARRSWAEIERDQTGGPNRHKKHHSHPIQDLGLCLTRSARRALPKARCAADWISIALAARQRSTGTGCVSTRPTIKLAPAQHELPGA